MTPANAVPSTGIEYPQFKVLGQVYSLKMGMGARYRLSKNKIDVAALGVEAPVAMFYELGACMLGTILPGGRWKAFDISPQELADQMAEEDFPRFIDAVKEALEKALPAASPSQPEPTNGQIQTAEISG